MHTQLAKREQQPGIVMVLVEPFLRLPDLPDHIAGLTITVQRDQFAVPLRVQAVGEQLLRERAAAVPDQRTRSGSGNLDAPLEIGG